MSNFVSPTARKIALAAAVILLGLYIANVIITPLLVGETNLEAFFRPKGELPFGSDKWRTTSAGGGERYKMVDDLLKKKLLLGRTQVEVKAILGEPSIAAPEDGEPAMYYLIGSQKDYPARSIFFPGRLGNLENWTLTVRFQDGRSYSAAVKVD